MSAGDPIAGTTLTAHTRWIPTPEGIALSFQVATAGDRIVAFSIDFLLILLVTIGVYFAAIFTIPFGAGSIGFAVATLVSFLFWAALGASTGYFYRRFERWAG